MISTILFTIVFASAALAWTWTISKWRNGKSVLPLESPRYMPWEGIDLLAAIGIYIVASAACLTIAERWYGIELLKLDENPDSHVQLILLQTNLAINVSVFFAFIAFVHLRTAATWVDVGFDLSHIKYDVACGAVAFVATVPVIYAIQAVLTSWIPYKHPLVDVVEKQPDALTMWIAGISAVLVAPVFEEFFFRGVLQGWLEKLELSLINRPSSTVSGNSSLDLPDSSSLPKIRFPRLPLGTGITPILISSLLFALIHLGQGPAPIALFFFALVLGFLYRQTHRLWPSITVHFLLNAVTMVTLLSGDKP